MTTYFDLNNVRISFFVRFLTNTWMNQYLKLLCRICLHSLFLQNHRKEAFLSPCPPLICYLVEQHFCKEHWIQLSISICKCHELLRCKQLCPFLPPNGHDKLGTPKKRLSLNSTKHCHKYCSCEDMLVILGPKNIDVILSTK